MTQRDRPTPGAPGGRGEDPFEEIVSVESGRDPDLAAIEAGSRTLRTQTGARRPDDLPGRPADPATDQALREVEAELAQRWGVHVASSGQGKVVWFEVGAPSAAAWESFADTLLAEGAPGDL